MICIAEKLTEITIPVLVEQVLQTGKLSRKEHIRLTSAVLADYQVAEVECCQMRRILDYVQTGRIRLID